MRVRNLFLLGTFFLSSTSLAMFCPNNMNQINIGDPLAVVLQQCGTPLSQKATTSKPDVPQEWNYYLKLAPTDTATIKTSVAFAGGRVINISVNNVGITNTGICGTTIQVGDPQDKVQAACGKPAFILQNNGPADQVQKTKAPTKDVDLTYTSGMGTATLHFENGLLKGINK